MNHIVALSGVGTSTKPSCYYTSNNQWGLVVWKMLGADIVIIASTALTLYMYKD